MRGYWEIRWPHCDYLRAPVPPQNSQKYIFVTKQVVILFHCCTNGIAVMKSSFPETLVPLDLMPIKETNKNLFFIFWIFMSCAPVDRQNIMSIQS